jgi:TonB family protein
MTLHEIWDDLIPPERRLLGLFVLASLLGHVLFFFMVKVVSPSVQGLAPRPSRVTWLTGAQMGSSATWLDWRDPSAIALPRSPLPILAPPESLPELPDRYADLAELSQDFRAGILAESPAELPERVGEKTATADKPSLVKVETPPLPGGTRVAFFGALANRELTHQTELPQPAVSENLRVTVLSVGVSDEGHVESLMVEESSLDASVDQKAIAGIRQWKFKPKQVGKRSTAIDWGRVVIYWDLQNKPRTPVPTADGGVR